MARKELEQWAQRFSTDLGAGLGRAPFDRIVRHHHSEIQRLLDAHLTFVTLAAALARAGAVRADGRPYTADQLYTAVRRALSSLEHQRTRASAPDKVGAGNSENRPPPMTHRNRSSRNTAAKDLTTKLRVDAPVPETPIRQFALGNSKPETNRDLTDEDVSAALRRIRKSD